MKIVHLSAECYPIAKVGGLADVAGALPKYQQQLGHDSAVIMPFYDNAYTRKHSFKEVSSGQIQSGQVFDYRIITPTANQLGFPIYLIDIPELLFTPFVYSEDDTQRFIAFQVAALDWILRWDSLPDVVHCHDHHVGLVPFIMTNSHKFGSLASIPTVFTIHNAQYQGWFDHERGGLLPPFPNSQVGLLDWGGVINPLAAAIKCAWRVTTVSPSYMEELKLKANGLESLLAHEHAKCVGILNGIDTDVWNTETDDYLVKNYTKTQLQSGKKANKAWLCKTYNLDPKKPLFAFIGRLVGEKGADLFPDIFRRALASDKISVFLLGSGHAVTESQLESLKSEFGGSYNAFIGYDERLSHIIYAGADFLLMPSRVEPCGLNQMYSLRYGTIPIVSSVGGLKDTVIDVADDGFGFRHDEVTGEAVVKTIKRATRFYSNQAAFRKTRRAIVKLDHSWTASAVKYIELYQSVIS